MDQITHEVRLARRKEVLKDFNWSGYHFDDDLSSEREYVIIRTEVPVKGRR